jgi:hypothetical protein
MSKTPRHEFTLSDEELRCAEMVFIAMTMLESRGYPGFVELFAILNDPTLILKIVRLLYGTEIKVPPLGEFVKCLQAATYTYCDMHKMVNSTLPAKPKDIRQFMDIDEKQEKELLDIFDEWIVFLKKNDLDIRTIMHCNRNNTKKRIGMNLLGKKWKAKKY